LNREERKDRKEKKKLRVLGGELSRNAIHSPQVALRVEETGIFT
jgi:hypothetical protein